MAWPHPSCAEIDSLILLHDTFIVWSEAVGSINVFELIRRLRVVAGPDMPGSQNTRSIIS